MRKVNFMTIIVCLLLIITSTAMADEQTICNPYCHANEFGRPGVNNPIVTTETSNGKEVQTGVNTGWSIIQLSNPDMMSCNLTPIGGDGCPGTVTPQKYKEKLEGKCGCPTTPQYKIDGCNITVSCNLEDDNATIVELKVPCPTVAGTDPKYPLVKMLAGTLVEWRVDDKYVDSPHTIKYTNRDTKEGYGTEIFTDFDLSIVVSTVDTGAKWDYKKAQAIVKGTDKHSRTNVEMTITGGNPNVKVMTAKEIYNAYKKKSDEVQAYLVLAGKGWGERPWTTYEKFIEGMCKMSENPAKCNKYLTGKDYLNFKGNFFLGNGAPTVFGVYSEISSHGCHGAATIDDKGNPAFGFKFKSTFCIYIHSSWQGYFNYGNTRTTFVKTCCALPKAKIINHGAVCYGNAGDPDNPRTCYDQQEVIWECLQWVDLWACEDGYNFNGPGESAEDCKECIDIEGWIDASGNMHTDLLPVSFYQSQPLLMRGN